MNNPYAIIRRPLVTEKNMHRAEARGEYSFEVSLNSNKIEIRKAVEESFGVKVVRVRTAIKKGGERRVGHHISQSPDVKKAIVKLAEGQRIDLL